MNKAGSACLCFLSSVFDFRSISLIMSSIVPMSNLLRVIRVLCSDEYNISICIFHDMHLKTLQIRCYIVTHLPAFLFASFLQLSFRYNFYFFWRFSYWSSLNVSIRNKNKRKKTSVELMSRVNEMQQKSATLLARTSSAVIWIWIWDKWM